MELHEIRYFLALSRTLNFTKAAEACKVSQPSLTRAIQKMETEFGGLLFSRERNHTHLTELGRLIEPHLQEIISRTEAARESATRFLRLDRAQLRLGVTCTIGPLCFISFLGAFRADQPGVDITLMEDVPDSLCDLLIRGELDVALISRPEGFAPPLHAQALYKERFVIACAASHPFASENAVRVAELDGQPYLVRLNCEYRDFLRDTCEANGALLAATFHSEQEEWILGMVGAGMGVCFLPEFSSVIPGVITRPVIEPSVERDVCLVTVAGRRWSSPAAAFVRAARQYPWPASKEAGGAGDGAE